MSATVERVDPVEIVGLEIIRAAVLESASLPIDQVKDRYLVIGDALYHSAQVLRLDEDYSNLLTFAVGVAEELSDVQLARALKFSNQRHWQYRPLILKSEAGNSPYSELVAEEYQKDAMIDCLLYHLIKDARFESGARALMAVMEAKE
ncbi:hypothetical protein [Lysobacter capsici]|uniref:hypothetical protein n=1 Tax=Lysobacter capsici TaxID=435897 RepID=UPI000BBAEFA8|nr:hypothetical protein [Lysobacter capsici]ATE73190.1 hypothetical protein CNO08_18605 [Lysobacter capsici]